MIFVMGKLFSNPILNVIIFLSMKPQGSEEGSDVPHQDGAMFGRARGSKLLLPQTEPLSFARDTPKRCPTVPEIKVQAFRPAENRAYRLPPRPSN